MEQRDWYGIRQVAQITGLSTQLIRKWEERYGAVEPKRLENGYRVYSAKDVMRIKQLQKLVSEGYSIRNAVLYMEQNHIEHGLVPDREQDNLQESAPPYATKQTQMMQYMDLMLAYGERGDNSGIQDLLQKVYSQHGLKYLSENLLMPFLHEVGERWEAHLWDEFQEHISSLAVRDFLIRQYSSFIAAPDAPLFLAACIPGERHEIMLHLAMLEAAIRGFKTSYLGISPAPNALRDAVESLRPKVVALSLTTSVPVENNPLLFDELDQLASRYRDTRFYIGGHGAHSYFNGNWKWLRFSGTLAALFSDMEE